MKKILIITFLLLSCDDLGVQEFEDSFSYYDYLSYGWSKIFENDIDSAENYFNESLNVDVAYYNNAMVGMGWAMTYLANNCLNPNYVNYDEDCINSTVGELRNNAKCFFYRSTLLNEDLSAKKFQDVLSWCEDEVDINFLYSSVDIMSLDLSNIVSFYKDECKSDQNGDIENLNCYENFVLDLQVGHLYLEYMNHQNNLINNGQICIDDNDVCTETDELIQLFDSFLIANPEYNIIEDKANYNDNYDINYKKIEARISQLYLDSNQVDKVNKSCEYSKRLCPEIECETDNQIDNIIEILSCIQINL